MDEKVMAALGEWVLRVTAKETTATPEEIAALPEVAKIYLNNVLQSPS
ncbi:MAG: hypothetical protein FWC70_05520 [Defluviitaleaceae bacterium]|nr:hypothetical protein [Defluviitaleaceae bacterium]